MEQGSVDKGQLVKFKAQSPIPQKDLCLPRNATGTLKIQVTFQTTVASFEVAG